MIAQSAAHMPPARHARAREWIRAYKHVFQSGSGLESSYSHLAPSLFTKIKILIKKNKKLNKKLLKNRN